MRKLGNVATNMDYATGTPIYPCALYIIASTKLRLKFLPYPGKVGALADHS